MKKLLSLLLVTASAPALLSSAALAQSVLQSGSVTPGHAARWVSSGVIGDAGTAASGSVTSLGVTNNGGPGLCINSAAITGPYNQICLAATTNGGSKISSYAYGGATTPGITFDINGSIQGFPSVTLPVTNNTVACFDGTTGALKQCSTGTTFAFPVSFTALPTSINATGWIASASGSLGFLDNGVNTFIRAPTGGGIQIQNQAGTSPGLIGVQGMVVGLDLLPTSGRPYCDVRGMGALGNGIADDTAAFNSCKTVLNNLAAPGGGTIGFPPGIYCLNNARVESTDTSIFVIGAGENATFLSACAVDARVITLNSRYSALKYLTVLGVASLSTTKDAVTTEALCGSCIIQQVHVIQGYYNFHIQGSDNVVTDSSGAYPYGPSHLLADSATPGGIAGLRINNGSFDQNYPLSLPTAPINVVNWQSTHAYTAGDLAVLNGWIIQAMTSGTSGGSAPTLQNYLVSFSDGGSGLTWQIAARFPGALVECGLNCSEMLLDMVDMSGVATYGFWGSGSNNFLVHITNSVMSGSVLSPLYAQFGSDYSLIGNEIFGALQANGAALLFESTYSGGATVSNNTITTSNTTNGVGVRISGGNGVVVNNNTIRTNSLGVLVDANVSNFNVIGNNILNNTNAVTISAGTSNHYNVIGNSVNTPPSDGGSGTNKTVAFNDGTGTASFSSLTLTSGSNSITLDPANATFNLAVNSNGAGAQIAWQRNGSSNGGRLLQSTNDGPVRVFNSANAELTLGANNVTTYWHVATDGGFYSQNVAGGPSFGVDTIAAKLIIGNQNTGALPSLAAGTTFASGSADAAANLFSQYSWANFTGFQGSRANGTNASKTTLVDGDTIIRIGAAGYDGSAYSAVKGAIDLRAAGTWSGTSTPTRIVLATTAVSSTTRTDRWILANDGGLYSANATGTTQGVDTINAKGFYKDGTLIAQTATSPLVITAGVIACATCGVTGSPLSQFASTTSAQLAGVISDETGTGVLVFGTSPTFTTSIIDPVVIGGAAAGSTLELRSTSATGSGDLVKVTGGTNGGTTVATFLGTGSVGIGTTSPQALLHISANTGSPTLGAAAQLFISPADGASGGRMQIDGYGGPAIFSGRRGNNTFASPTALTSGQGIIQFTGDGYDGSAFTTSTPARFRITAAENWSSTAHGTAIDFSTTANTTTTLAIAMTIQASGGLSIGATTDPGTGGLYVNGATITLNGLATDATHTDRTVCQDTTSKSLFFGSGAAGICLGTSSRRFKRDIVDARAGLAEVLKLQPRNFHYLPGYGGEQLQYGFIAEEVAGVIPTIVGHDAQHRANSVDYIAMVPILTKAVQELSGEVEALKRRRSAKRN